MKYSYLRYALSATVATMFLTACGGGGSPSSGTAPAPAPAPDPAVPVGPQAPEVSNDPGLSFFPSVLNRSLFRGESEWLAVRALANQDYTGVVNIAVVDTKGVLTKGTQVRPAYTPRTYLALLEIAPTLAPGIHTGTIEVRLCKDNPLTCASPHPGSPWRLPYRIEVKQPDLRPLAPLPGGVDWTTYQGSEKHHGFIPVTLNPSRFSPRYMWTSPLLGAEIGMVKGAQISSLVNRDGAVFFSVDAERLVYAIDEATGATKWTFKVPSGPGPHRASMNPVAVGGGKVYMATSGHEAARMFVLDEKNGAKLAESPISAQFEHYFSASVDASGAYANAGKYGGLYKFDAANNSQTWFAELPQFDRWTPALGDKHAYAYFPSGSYGLAAALRILDKATGAQVATILDPGAVHTQSLDNAPVLYSPSNLLVRQGSIVAYGRLVNFDLAARTVKWALSDRYYTDPVVSGSLLYVLNNDQVEARRLSDGGLEWTWQLPSEEDVDFGFYVIKRKNMIVTNNLLFVAADNTTYALDLATHKPVWSYPRGGELSMSKNGVLFINTSDAHIIAISVN